MRSARAFQQKQSDTAPADTGGARRASQLTDTKFARDKKGNNQLWGNDQLNEPSERKAVPDVKKETDGVVESFEKLDNVRASTTSARAIGNSSSTTFEPVFIAEW